VTGEPDPSDSLIEKVLRDEISPAAAEAEAKRLGLGPLARKPKESSSFDPMNEPWWTLPMALAWIVWRRPQQVLRCWDKYRLKCWAWRWALGRHRLVQDRPATLRLLLRAERSAEALKGPGTKIIKSVMSVRSAKAELWRALQDGTLQATGINFDTGRRVRIPDLEWHDLECIEEEGRDIVRARNITARLIKRAPRRGTTEKLVGQLLQGRDDVDPTRRSAAHGYANVLVRRTEIMANWHSHEPAPTDAAAERLKATEPAPTKAGRHGALPKYNWAAIETFVFKLMDEKGEFRESDIPSGWRTRADLERRVLEYFEGLRRIEWAIFGP
jgi:hypothetical protein